MPSPSRFSPKMSALPALPTLNVVGAGRVAQTLANLWHSQRSFAVQDVLTTTLRSAEAACSMIGSGRAVAHMQDMRKADVWLLGVPDAQLAHCAQTLAAAHTNVEPISQPTIPCPNSGTRPTNTPIIFHCSGAHGAATLEPLAALGWRVASAHCILSFTSVPNAIAQFPGTACALEGDAVVCDVLRTKFSAIGARCFDVASGDKLLYHAAAVFATNFLPVLQATAEQLWRATGVPAEVIVDLRAALLRNAVANITAVGPQAALTGPAARGDIAAIKAQAAALAVWDVPTGAAYEALCALALRMARNDATARE